MLCLSTCFFPGPRGNQQLQLEISVPTKMVGAVIGRYGQNIQEIGRRSHTKISRFNPTDSDGMRRCNIYGTQNDINYAVEMINDTINRLRNRN